MSDADVPTGPPRWRVVEVAAGDTHDVRQRVLRDHRPEVGAELPEDRLPGTVHLAVLDDGGAAVGVATVFPEATPHRPGARAARLRGMAVDHHLQGAGVGSCLLAAVVERARRDGCRVLWADGRDQAIGFYERHGWRVVGDGFIAMGLPHHVVILDLEPAS